MSVEKETGERISNQSKADGRPLSTTADVLKEFSSPVISTIVSCKKNISHSCSFLLFTQTRPHTLPHPSLECLLVFAQQFSCLDIGWTLVVGTSEHTYDADQYSLGRLNGRPSLGCGFVTPSVFAGGVENWYTDFAWRVDCIHEIEISAWVKLTLRVEGWFSFKGVKTNR